MTFGLDKASKNLKIRYLVIDANTSYNILLGRSFLNKLGAIVSTSHLAMKFLSLSGDFLTIHVDQKIAMECYAECLRVEPVEANGVQALKNPNPLKDVEAFVVLGVAVLV